MTIGNNEKGTPNFIRKEPKKKVASIQLDSHTGDYQVSTIPNDKDAPWTYHSKAGGFIPTEAALTQVMTHGLHYGGGAFEGERYFISKKGVVMMEPALNIIRLINSVLLLTSKKERILFGEIEGNLSRKLTENEIIKGKTYTAEELFAIGREWYKDPNAKAKLTIGEIYKNNKYVGDVTVDYTLPVVMGDKIRHLTIWEIDALIKMLGFINKFVPTSGFPEKLTLIPGGYIRPLWFMSGEMGLKLANMIIKTENNLRTVIEKPGYFIVGTLPWGRYLDKSGYEKGLDVVVGPRPRIGDDMPGNAKAAGIYLNSTANVSYATLDGGYHEILALNKDGNVVEGSAETIFTIKQEGNRMIAYTPPTGDGVLPGTTRDRIIRTLGKMNIEIIYRSLSIREMVNAKAILFAGTAAQIVHVNSITKRPDLYDKIMGISTLMSEDSPNKEDIIITPQDVNKSEREKYLINEGKKHPIVNEISKEYFAMVNDKGLEPIHNLNPYALASALELDVSEIATREFLNNFKNGRYSEHVTNPEKLKENILEVARMMDRAMKINKNKTTDNSRNEIRGMVHTLSKQGNGPGRLKGRI